MPTHAQQALMARLRELLGAQRVTDVAERSGIAPEQLSRWRTGALLPNPTLRTLERLARALGVSVGYLLGESTELPASVQRDAERRIAAIEEQLASVRQQLS